MTVPQPEFATDTGVVARLRAAYHSGKTRPLAWRRAQLEGLRRMLIEQEKPILEALHADLRKHPTEGWTTEIASVKDEIRVALKSLTRWTAPRKVRTAMLAMPGKSWLMPEPLGVVLNIAAWNYPIQEGLTPMASALAAGNCVVLKPSELAPATARVLQELLHVHDIVGEGGTRLGLGYGDGRDQRRFRMYDAHTATAAAAGIGSFTIATELLAKSRGPFSGAVAMPQQCSLSKTAAAEAVAKD